jgi:hypothetical protein
MRSQILRTIPKISLRSLAAEIKLSVRISGDSTLWIITRGSSIRDRDAAILKLRYETECKRLFYIFGTLIGPQHEFKFINKGELAEFTETSPESIVEDWADLRLKYHDNGDDKTWFEVIFGKAQPFSKHVCRYYAPTFDPSNVMIAGSGNSVLLKNITVRQVMRELTPSRSRGNHCECCTLF